MMDAGPGGADGSHFEVGEVVSPMRQLAHGGPEVAVRCAQQLEDAVDLIDLRAAGKQRDLRKHFCNVATTTISNTSLASATENTRAPAMMHPTDQTSTPYV
jgi:hypothetical protein